MQFFDGLLDPRGPAWMVDRPALIACLEERASDLGVTFIATTKPAEFERSHAGWIIRSSADGIALPARYLIDATGRAGTVARRLGIQRLFVDNQIAVIAVLTGDQCHDGESIMVEAVEDGWWYSADAPQVGLVMAFFTDRDLLHLRSARDAEGFEALLTRSTVTGERRRKFVGHNFDRPEIVDARSSVLAQVAGDGWIAAGDAALTYDPLSGHGLTLALASGRDAGLAVRASISGDRAAFSVYAERLAGAKKAYAERRAVQYAAERRWSENPFWQRRHRVLQPIPE